MERTTDGITRVVCRDDHIGCRPLRRRCPSLQSRSAAIGYVVETDGWTEEGSEHLGKATNNEAEYRALIRGLEVASEEGCAEVEAKGDSQLVVKQVRDEWSVNEPELRPLRDRVQELAEEFETFEIEWVNREENLRADELVEREFDD